MTEDHESTGELGVERMSEDGDPTKVVPAYASSSRVPASVSVGVGSTRGEPTTRAVAAGNATFNFASAAPVPWLRTVSSCEMIGESRSSANRGYGTM